MEPIGRFTSIRRIVASLRRATARRGRPSEGPQSEPGVLRETPNPGDPPLRHIHVDERDSARLGERLAWESRNDDRDSNLPVEAPPPRRRQRRRTRPGA
jgi:hypothetical protein